MRVQSYSSFDALPPRFDALFEQASPASFCLTRTWFELLARNILNGNDRLQLIGVENGRPESPPLGLLVARCRDRDPDFRGARSLSSLANFYTMLFRPLLAETAEPARVLDHAIEAVCRCRPRYDVVRLQPLDPASETYRQLCHGLRQAGLVVHPYFHFGNWYERIDGRSFQAYLEQRPGPLRNTVQRKASRLFDRAAADFRLIAGGAALEDGIAAYERVYRASWKPAETYPRFISDLVRFCAARGALRLGLLYVDGEPAAAQIWIVWGRIATVYKLAHDRRFDSLSPGTVLTMRMMQHVIDVDGVDEVDFGAGDDRYKRDWMSGRRERWGLIACNPRTVRGAAGIARYVIPSRIKQALLRRRAKPTDR